ncbi:M23 family metallopeptidase [Sandarakinorhabdus sp.]|uniref:M23 family metallopeptidase n=1 Tax=Sandarakinorhabdus sp. TaxID=1916663 RepID=UPI00333F3A5B
MRAGGAPALLWLLLLVLPACSRVPPLAPPPAARAVPRSAAPPRAAAAKPVSARRTDWVARRVVPNAVVTPQGRFHTVGPGETGIAIAQAYGASWRDMVSLNGLKEPYVLRLNQRLRLPALPNADRLPARPPQAADIEARARAFAITIDDVVTGGQPAAAKVPPPSRRPAPAAGDEAPTPLPAITGAAPAFRWPLPGRVVSGFGPKAGGRFNDGINLKASIGEAVRAAGDGVVAYAGDAIPGFGNLLLVKHAGGWVSAYGHNDALLVARGTRVKAGEVIARAGQTGAVAEPQLHFELRRGRTAVDPATLIGGR